MTVHAFEATGRRQQASMTSIAKDHVRGIDTMATTGIETSTEGQAQLESMTLEAGLGLRTVVAITTPVITEEACTTAQVTTSGTTTSPTTIEIIDETQTEADLTGEAFLPGVTTSTPRGTPKLAIKGTWVTVTATRKRDIETYICQI